METPWRRPGHHFVSPYNFAPEVTSTFHLPPGGTVDIYDSTIRKTLLVPGGKLAPADQVRIAAAVAEAGVTGLIFNCFYDRARLKASPKFAEIHEGARAIGRQVKGMRKVACLYALTRGKGFDGKEACELALDAGIDVLEPGIPASDLEREADMPGVSREALLDAMAETIAYCKSLGAAVACNFTDAGRADLEYLARGIERAVEAGATDVRLSDSYSAFSPHGVQHLVRSLRARLRQPVPLMVHIHNDYGLATAAGIAAALEGCHVDTTVNGLGDKGGFAALEEVALALEVLYGVPTGIRLEKLAGLSNLVEELTGIRRAPMKPVVGSDIFHVEADAAVARMLRGQVTLEDPGARVVTRTYEPAIVGRTRRVVWGRVTLDGAAVSAKLEQLKLQASDAQVARIVAAVKSRLDRMRRYPVWLTEREVEALCRQVAGKAKRPGRRSASPRATGRRAVPVARRRRSGR